MSSVLLMVGCFVLGALARKWLHLPADSHRVLNTWVLFISLPALVIRVIHSVPLSHEMVWAVVGMWVVFAVPALIALRWARAEPLSRNAFAGAMALCLGLGNTAFVGYPLLGMLGGTSAVGVAAILDQLGTFIMLALGAVPLATHLGGQGVSMSKVLRRLITFPPMIALLVAFASRPFTFSPAVDEVLERLASMLTPLALASVGWQFEPSSLRGQAKWVGIGLGWKLGLAPLLMLALLRLAGAHGGELERVAVAQAGMAPMVTAGVLATEFELDSRLASALIALGTPLSFATVPLWWWLLG